MSTDTDPAAMPENRCQLIKGFTPARQNRMDLAPLLKTIQSALGITIHGSAVWLSSDGQLDKLLLFSGTTVYSTPLYNVWNYDERLDGQHSYYSLGALTTVATAGTSAAAGVTSLQFKTELIISIGGLLYRYYVTDPGGVENFWQLGLNTPGAPSLAQSAGGALTVTSTYSYITTMVDEFGRESSPSDPTSLLLTGANRTITVTRGSGTTGGLTGIVSWNIYRLNPGATTYNFVTTVAIGTGNYADANADAVVATGDVAPSAGENDPPGALGPPFAGSSNIMEFWKDRLVLNDEVSPSTIQISNAGSPTQFSSLDLPDNATDGLRVMVGGKGDNEVTGLANLGSLLAVFKRTTISLLYGDDSSTFVLRPAHERGCANPRSVQRCENDVFFLSDDGIYTLGYENGYAIRKISSELDHMFQGFSSTANPDEFTSTGRQQSIQVASAVFLNVNSFYSQNRYYISLGNRTLCYCLQANGWSDAGYGFIKTVTRYLAQNAQIPGSAPETVFLTIADLGTFATQLNYFTVADTPKDKDAPATVNATYTMRPFDGDGPPENRTKRFGLLAQYGVTSAKRGQRIGTITGYADGVMVEEWPVFAWSSIRKHGSLFEQQWTTAMKGEVMWAELNITYNDVSLGDTIQEYTFLS